MNRVTFYSFIIAFGLCLLYSFVQPSKVY